MLVEEYNEETEKIERKKDTIKDKLKYEQKLFQLYLKGELKFDKDIQMVIDNMGE